MIHDSWSFSSSLPSDPLGEETRLQLVSCPKCPLAKVIEARPKKINSNHDMCFSMLEECGELCSLVVCISIMVRVNIDVCFSSPSFVVTTNFNGATLSI